MCIRDRCILPVMQMAIVIGNGPAVASSQTIEVNVGAQIVELGIERSFRVVIVHFPTGQLSVPNRQVEDAGVRCALAWGCNRQVAFACVTDQHVHNRMLDDEFA